MHCCYNSFPVHHCISHQVFYSFLILLSPYFDKRIGTFTVPFLLIRQRRQSVPVSTNLSQVYEIYLVMDYYIGKMYIRPL